MTHARKGLGNVHDILDCKLSADNRQCEIEPGATDANECDSLQVLDEHSVAGIGGVELRPLDFHLRRQLRDRQDGIAWELRKQ